MGDVPTTACFFLNEDGVGKDNDILFFENVHVEDKNKYFVENDQVEEEEEEKKTKKLIRYFKTFSTINCKKRIKFTCYFIKKFLYRCMFMCKTIKD